MMTALAETALRASDAQGGMMPMKGDFHGRVYLHLSRVDPSP